MAPSSATELAETLLRTELLSRAPVVKVAELLAGLSDDPQELAYALVQRGWLSSYQAEQALEGKTEKLVMGGYQLLVPLGAGGMGQVFKARQTRLNRIVALKLIREDLLASNPGAVRRFKREALAVAQLSHPNIVVIYDFDEADGTYFIVMEYVDGQDLGQLVEAGGVLPVPLACDYVRQAALGLQHAAEHGMVHRDIKPSNLLVARPDARVKILDLGLARVESSLETHGASLTREGAMMGTPDYVAPEQARDASSVDIRADLYSLGCTFFYLLTGRPPFPDGTMMERLLKHQFDVPPPVESLRGDVPPQVRAVVRKLLQKDPDQRFQQPAELAETLAGVLDISAVQGLSTPPVMLNLPASAGDPASAPLPRREPPATPPPARGAFTGRLVSPPPADANPAVTMVTAVSLQQVHSDTEYLPDGADVLQAKKEWVLKGHNGSVLAVTFSADGQLLATGGLDHTIRLWTLGKPPRELAHFPEPLLGDVQTLAFSPAGDQLASGSASLNARMFLWSKWRNRGNVPQPLDGSASYSDCMAFSPDGKELVSATGATLFRWPIADGRAGKRSVVRNPSGDDIKVAVFSPDGERLVTGDARGNVHFWKKGWLGDRPVTTLVTGHGGIASLAFSADGMLLATGGVDHRIQIWDGAGASDQPKGELTKKLHGVVKRMLFPLPDPDLLLSAGTGGQVILWNLALGQAQHEWKLDQKLIYGMAISNDGSFVATGASDGTVALFDLVPE
ncbi:MAG: WD40 repeat domain-containing serine/threonine protein kinase [Gemmataceae bacterium]